MLLFSFITVSEAALSGPPVCKAVATSLKGKMTFILASIPREEEKNAVGKRNKLNLTLSEEVETPACHLFRNKVKVTSGMNWGGCSSVLYF